MKYVSVSEMIAIEQEANAGGLSYEIMMENAGHGLAEVILDSYGYMEDEGALGLVGSGNNGGDTLVALSYLSEEGWKASAYILRPRPADDPLVARLLAAGGSILTIEDDPQLDHLKALIREHGILLDGILGTGFRLPLKSPLTEILETIKAELTDLPTEPLVVAVDCPSGVDCDTGEAAPECIPADITVTMAAMKHGLLKFPAFDLVGETHLVDIGLPEGGEQLESWREVSSIVADADWVAETLPDRPLNAHKGTFGTAMVLAGSLNYTGAVLLAGEAAYRVGAGLVTIAAPTPLHAALAGQITEATWLLLPHEMGVIAESAAGLVRKSLDRITALLIGPGMGQEETTGNFMRNLMAGNVPVGRQIGFVHPDASTSADGGKHLPPLVIDADGLKLLVQISNWTDYLPKESILTPHPGEMSILTGLSTEEIQSDRFAVANRFSQEWGQIVVLKGAFTIIASPSGQSAIIPVATPALARAGTGDVLAGLIVGLRAQGVDPFGAAVAGAWVHAQAGLLAQEIIGNSASVLASDILAFSVEVLSMLDG